MQNTAMLNVGLQMMTDRSNAEDDNDENNQVAMAPQVSVEERNQFIACLLLANGVVAVAGFLTDERSKTWSWPDVTDPGILVCMVVALFIVRKAGLLAMRILRDHPDSRRRRVVTVAFSSVGICLMFQSTRWLHQQNYATGGKRDERVTALAGLGMVVAIVLVGCAFMSLAPLADLDHPRVAVAPVADPDQRQQVPALMV